MTELMPRELKEFTEDKIKELMSIDSVESERFDFKREFSENGKEKALGIEKDICAMANTLGGFIVVGIGEDSDDKQKPFSCRGLDDIRLAEQKTKECLARVAPIPAYDMKKDVKINGKDILILEIKESKNKPHVIKDKGQIFVRIGSHSHPASRDVIMRLFSDISQIRKNLTILKPILERIMMSAKYNQQCLRAKDGYPSEADNHFLKIIMMNIGEFLIERNLLDDIGRLLTLINLMNGKVRNAQTLLSNRASPVDAYRCSNFAYEAAQIEEVVGDGLIKRVDALLEEIKA